MNSMQRTGTLAVALCLCIVLVNAQSGIVSSIVNVCGGGVGSKLCQAALSKANKFCAGKDQQGNCVQAAIQICSKSKDVCKQVAGPLCKATGSYASACETAVAGATAKGPAGDLAGSLLSRLTG